MSQKKPAARRKRQSLLRSGEPFIWLSATALAIILLLLASLFALIASQGLSVFWPKSLTQLKLSDGAAFLGEVLRHSPAEAESPAQVQLKIGNRDTRGADFVWLPADAIVEQHQPNDAVLIERLEWGNFYGFLRGLKDTTPIAGDEQHIFAAVRERIREAEGIRVQIAGIEGELRGMTEQPTEARTQLAAELQQLQASLSISVIAAEATGEIREIPLSRIVRIIQPNTMTAAEKAQLYLARLWEFISAEPRESNTEGGIFPAIFGTVLMVLLMSILVTPLGVLAAIYLREYAKQGRFVSLVRIAVNNLAGVPSIVFGVFGLGFFVYSVGGSIDQLFFAERLPSPTFGTGGILWASLTLALLTLPTVIVATEEGLAAIPRPLREASYALGATRFETMWRVVLPSLAPSILTGVILAVSRAAGEVAPLMITGVVKLAPALPTDSSFPYLHLNRKFMHLGFHIYDVGFQSPNVDAAAPMVFATTLLLIVLVVFLNLAAIGLRNHLRQKLSGSAV